MIQSRAYYSGFGDSWTNHQIYLKALEHERMRGGKPVEQAESRPFNGQKNSEFIPIVRPPAKPANAERISINKKASVT